MVSVSDRALVLVNSFGHPTVYCNLLHGMQVHSRVTLLTMDTSCMLKMAERIITGSVQDAAGHAKEAAAAKEAEAAVQAQQQQQWHQQGVANAAAARAAEEDEDDGAVNSSRQEVSWVSYTSTVKQTHAPIHHEDRVALAPDNSCELGMFWSGSHHARPSCGRVWVWCTALTRGCGV